MDKRLCQAPNLEKWMLEKVKIILSSFLRQTCSSYSANVHFTHFPFLFTARAVRFGTFDYVIEQIQKNFSKLANSKVGTLATVFRSIVQTDIVG